MAQIAFYAGGAVASSNTPTSVAATASAGSGSNVSRDDHVHDNANIRATAAPSAIAATASVGSGTLLARSDHVHSDAGVIAHTAATSAVHGLGASVNFLGNRNASGEFIQRGQATSSGSPNSSFTTVFFAADSTITFPVAFSSVPRVFLQAGRQRRNYVSLISVSTTAITYVVNGSSSADTLSQAIDWLAIGS